MPEICDLRHFLSFLRERRCSSGLLCPALIFPGKMKGKAFHQIRIFPFQNGPAASQDPLAADARDHAAQQKYVAEGVQLPVECQGVGEIHAHIVKHRQRPEIVPLCQ